MFTESFKKKLKTQFEEDGFFIIESIIKQNKLIKIKNICDNIVLAKKNELIQKRKKIEGINVLNSRYFLGSTYKNNKFLRSIIFSDVLAEICRCSLGDEAFFKGEQFVVKFKDKESNFAWHQDSGYSVYSGGSEEHKPYITCWLALDNMTKDNGTISLQTFKNVGNGKLMKHNWNKKKTALIGYSGNKKGLLMEVPKGSIICFSSFSMHRSGPNKTQLPRRSWVIQYTPKQFKYLNNPSKFYTNGPKFIENGKNIFSENNLEN